MGATVPRKKTEKLSSPFACDVFGSFPFSTVNVDASYTKTIVATDDIKFTSDSSGTTGNSLYVRAVADGNQKACVDCDIDAGCANLDTIIQSKNGGDSYNSWKLLIAPHGHTGAGCMVYEDTLNGILNIWFEPAVTTVADVETAIGLSSGFEVKTPGTAASVLTTIGDAVALCSFSGGTPATSVTWATSNPHLTVHFTDGVTTITALKTAVNTSATNKSMTASSAGGSHTLVAADAFAATQLSGGVTAVALDTSLITGKGFTVARTGASGTGEYTLTFTDQWKSMHCGKVKIQQSTASAYKAHFGDYNATNRTVVIRAVNWSGAVDPAPGTNCALHFRFTMLSQ